MGDELAMMDMVSGKYFVLDRVGAEIWQALEQPTAVEALCRQLRERFEIAEARCVADVIPFLERLAAKNLLRVADGEP